MIKSVVVQFDALSVNGAYQQWHGDLARCGGCGAEVVTRYAERASWEHHRRNDVAPERPDVIVPEQLTFTLPLGAPAR